MTIQAAIYSGVYTAIRNHELLTGHIFPRCPKCKQPMIIKCECKEMSCNIQEREWPENIVADRHEVTKRWVLQYLTDEQAEQCFSALGCLPIGEEV